MLARIALLATIASAGATTPAAASPSNDAFRKEIAALAADIQAALKADGQASVAVGEFAGSPSLDAQYGPGIQSVLMKELAKLKVGVERWALYVVKGDYALDHVIGPSHDKLAVVKIAARLTKQNGEVAADLTAKLRAVAIKDNTTVAKIAGATVALPVTGDRDTRNEMIQKAVGIPRPPFIDGSKVAVSKDSKYAVEVLVRPHANGPVAPRAATIKDGHAFVNIEKSEFYELRLHNRDPRHEAAATVTIDGVDVFHFAVDRKPDGTPTPGYILLKPGSASGVPGWHVTNAPGAAKTVMRFQVVSIGDGAANKVSARAGQVGVVTLTFAAAADRPRDLPEDEQGYRTLPPPEDGIRPDAKEGAKEVKRTIGVVREILTIRYNH